MSKKGDLKLSNRRSRVTSEDMSKISSKLPFLLPEEPGRHITLTELARKFEITSPSYLEAILRSQKEFVLAYIKKIFIDNPNTAEKIAETMKIPNIIVDNNGSNAVVQLVSAKILMQEIALSESEETISIFKQKFSERLETEKTI